MIFIYRWGPLEGALLGGPLRGPLEGALLGGPLEGSPLLGGPLEGALLLGGPLTGSFRGPLFDIIYGWGPPSGGPCGGPLEGAPPLSAAPFDGGPLHMIGFQQQLFSFISLCCCFFLGGPQ